MSEIETRAKTSVPSEATRPGPVFQPDVDIVENPAEFVVTADLPGVDSERLQVRLEDGILTIDASVSDSFPESGWRLAYAEYQMGSFHRRFAISDGIDVERISAQMRDGVLTLHLPKAERHRARKIEVAH
jgi:HSP20 family protein